MLGELEVQPTLFMNSMNQGSLSGPQDRCHSAAHSLRIKFFLLQKPKRSYQEQLLGCAVLTDPFREERTKSLSGNVLTLNSMDDCDSD